MESHDDKNKDKEISSQTLNASVEASPIPPFESSSVTLQILSKSVESSAKKEANLSSRIDEAAQTIKDRETEREGRKNYFELRKKWSMALRLILISMVCFQYILAGGIGLKLIDFENYKNFLYIIIGENFVQMIGLCVVVINFLFPNGKDNK